MAAHPGADRRSPRQSGAFPTSVVGPFSLVEEEGAQKWPTRHRSNLLAKPTRFASDPALRERMIALRFRRDELAAEITALSQRLASADPTITPEKVSRLGMLLIKQVHRGEPELRQAYARLLLDEVVVNDGRIVICGSKSVLARMASAASDDSAESVLSFVRKWRARQDSNLLPQD